MDQSTLFKTVEAHLNKEVWTLRDQGRYMMVLL